MYCPKCKKMIPDNKAFLGQYCPICRNKLLNLGKEEATVSSEVVRNILSKSDKTKLPEKFVIKEYKNPIVETAHIEYEEIIRNDPGNVQAHYDLGLVYFKQGKVEEAIKFLKKSTILNKDFIEAYQKLAEIYAGRKKFNLALEMLKEVIRLDRTNIAALFNMGFIGLKLNNTELARNSFERVVKLDPENKEAKEVLEKIKKYEKNS